MSNGGPKLLYIIRHGEKLGDPCSDTDAGPDLSIQGSARASALPSLFIPATNELSCALSASGSSFSGQYRQNNLAGPAPRFQTPAFLFAAKVSTASNRPLETITPLSAALNLPCDTSRSDKDYGKLAEEIISDQKYSGSVVLICWHHGTIQQMAGAFHISNPPKWACTVFDRVWEIDFNPGPATLHDQPQCLLYGDSET